MQENFGYKLDLDFITKLCNGNSSTNILKLKKIEYISSSNSDNSDNSDNQKKQYLKMITYNKDLLSKDLIQKYGIYRSVILNQDNKVLCFSPPKSISYDMFIDKYPEKQADIIAEEFVEGTMINIFWDENIGLSGGWEISTKNNVGGANIFYQNTKTFREMFLEAVKENNLQLDLLNKKYCFSFILQHPDNRIIVRFKKPQLYFITCYSIFQFDNSSPYVLESDLSIIKTYINLNTQIKFPEIYYWNYYKELENKFASQNTNYEIVGVMIKNIKTGERTKIRNPVYEKIRKLKGNQTKLKYQFLELRKHGKIAEYLKYYPENKGQFSEFKDEIHDFTKTLLTNYISCYVKKEKPLLEFSPQFRTHMFKLHEIFLHELREKKLYINKQLVIDYIFHMDIPLLLNSLNYQINRKIITDN
jgi:hypothetical protein